MNMTDEHLLLQDSYNADFLVSCGIYVPEEYRTFAEDMRKAGYQVTYGEEDKPMVFIEEEDLQEVIRATNITVNWNSPEPYYVEVYPKF